MSQFKVYVLFPLLVIGLIYAGIKYYIHQGVAEEMDKVIAMARPFAHISYQGIASNLGGSVAVEGVEVRRPQQTMPVRIAEVRLEGPGTGFLFDLAKGFGRGHFPETLRMTFERVELPDVTDLFPDVEGFGNDTDVPALRQREPCSLGWLAQNIGMIKSDRYPLLLDLTSGYQFDVDSGIARMDFGYQVHSRESLGMEMYLTGVSQPGAVMLGAVPRMERLTLTYEPGREHVAALVNQCAQARGMEPSLYVQGLLSQHESLLGEELGFIPGAGIRDALRRFLTNPGAVTMEMGPFDTMMQMAAVESSPQQMMAMLDPRISVNGTPVTDLSFREATPGSRGTQGSGPADGLESIPDFKDGGKRVRARMLPATVEELPQYLGRDVHIYTPTHRRPLEGVLKSLANGVANVEKRVHGGTMTVHVPLADITKVAVYRFPRDGE